MKNIPLFEIQYYNWRTMDVARLCLILCHMFACFAENFIFEVEDAIFDHGRSNIIARSSASNGKVVTFKRGDFFYFEFCLNSESVIHVESVSYSNDGHADTFAVSVDGKVLTEVQTRQSFRGGAGWNDFVSVQLETGPVAVLDGRHRLTVKVVNADSYGVEIDYVSVSVDSRLTEDEFRCLVYCFNDIRYRANSTGNGTPATSIRQLSQPTLCAEEDNVNIPMFGAGVNSYTITATFPKYRSFINDRSPDFTNCTMVSPLWEFDNIILASDEDGNILPKEHTLAQYTDRATLVRRTYMDKVVLDVAFHVDGASAGVTDADIGSFLALRLRQVGQYTRIDLRYMGRYRSWSPRVAADFNREVTQYVWDIPDFTWREKGDNNIQLEIFSSDKVIYIDNIELQRRHRRKARSFHMYNDGKHLVEGADIDFWWLVNQTMTVRILDNGDVFHDADYFRIYSSVPWSKNHFSQIFVIYQDGNIRLLPVSPDGLDWVPFGSSILIGQSNVLSMRPSAPIRHIDISMEIMTLYIYFADGGSSRVTIIPKLTEIVLEVSDVNFDKDMSVYPFLTFRSMWVANGNADVDHVSVDDEEPRHVMSPWQEMRGSTFAFFRKCISEHNTQSPDIIVHIK